MTPNEYIGKTAEFDNHLKIYGALPYALGLAAEAGEVSNEYERSTREGWMLDIAKVRIELGDVLWQVARLCDYHGWTFEELMESNINKLVARWASQK